MGFERGTANTELLVMSTIPLDLERRFEQRWAARFARVPQEHRLEQQCQQITASGKSKRKARQVGWPGLRSSLSGVSSIHRGSNP